MHLLTAAGRLGQHDASFFFHTCLEGSSNINLLKEKTCTLSPMKYTFNIRILSNMLHACNISYLWVAALSFQKGKEA